MKRNLSLLLGVVISILAALSFRDMILESKGIEKWKTSKPIIIRFLHKRNIELDLENLGSFQFH